jgi:hypothetical protein
MQNSAEGSAHLSRKEPQGFRKVPVQGRQMSHGKSNHENHFVGRYDDTCNRHRFIHLVINQHCASECFQSTHDVPTGCDHTWDREAR